MKKVIAKVLFLTLCASVVFVSKGTAEGLLDGTGVSAAGSYDYYSKYVWRGYVLDENPVVQPGISFSGYGFTVGVWDSLPVTTDRAGGTGIEADVLVSYSAPVGPVALSVGHVYYTFPTIGPDTRELFACVSSGELLPLSLGVTYNYDYDAAEGSYVSLDASKGFPVGAFTGTVLAHYGLFNSYSTIENGGDYTVGLKLGAPLTSNLTITPALFYTGQTGDLEEQFDNASLYGGISLSYSL